jgi:hypothetical protein
MICSCSPLKESRPKYSCKGCSKSGFRLLFAVGVFVFFTAAVLPVAFAVVFVLGDVVAMLVGFLSHRVKNNSYKILKKTGTISVNFVMNAALINRRDADSGMF